jgi:uncharacterized protein (TIGR01777 family)
MKIVIPGGSGELGKLLSQSFLKEDHEVVVLSRRPTSAAWRVVPWDARNPGDWIKEIDGADVVINLTGQSVNCRYNAENRGAIMDSRTHSTRVVGEAIARAKHPPRLWLQAGTATIYAHRFDAPNDELTGIMGGHEPDVPDTWRFSIQVAQEWERAIDDTNTPHTRKVKMRSAMVMAPQRGSVFDVLLGLVRRGLGGSAGSGKQFVSWMHHLDFVNAVRWLIEHEELEGAVNLCSPHPLPYSAFMRALRQAWGMPIGLPATEWMLEIGTRIMRTESELVLKSRRVVPTRLLHSGFTFQYPQWPAAAQNLCAAWRQQSRR